MPIQQISDGQQLTEPLTGKPHQLAQFSNSGNTTHAAMRGCDWVRF
jgi:hypothetical protein